MSTNWIIGLIWLMNVVTFTNLFFQIRRTKRRRQELRQLEQDRTAELLNIAAHKTKKQQQWRD